ncbi:MAG: Ig-like domain-containing protein [Muribaculaceae bacterium]|nr:Ig-like domain-containing protein [Muribaculaceae bacterium]
MKKFFVAMAFALPLVFTSCNGNDEPIDLPSRVDVNVYESHALEVSGTWTSSNEFVATVDKKGNITAHHVGDAVITVVDGDRTASCKVNVKPVNTSYTFPFMVWGSDLYTVKSFNSNLTLLEEYADGEGGYILTYLTGNTFPGYVYYLDADALIANSIVVDINETDAWEAFMYQYYADLEEDEEWFYLINGNTVAEATIAVQYGWNDEDSIIATFMPLTEETRSGDIKEMFKNVDLDKSVLVNRK